MNQRVVSSYEYRLQDFPAVVIPATHLAARSTARATPDVAHSAPSGRVLLTTVGFSVASWVGLVWLTLATIHLVH